MYSRIGFTVFFLLMVIPCLFSQTVEKPSSLPSLPEQSPIRVETVNHIIWEGLSGGVQNGNLILIINHRHWTIPIDSILTIWRLKRATWKWAKTGIVVGSLAGGLGMAIGGYYVASLCEYDCPPNRMGFAFRAGTGGMVLGGASGGLLGAFLGSTHRYWQLTYQSGIAKNISGSRDQGMVSIYMEQGTITYSAKPPPTKQKSPLSSGYYPIPKSPIGVVSIQLNGSRVLSDGTMGGLGGGFSYRSYIFPRLSLGIDIQWFRPGKPRNSETNLPANRRVFHAGGIICYSLLTKPIQPYLLSGLYYSSYWYGNYVGFSFGTGVGYTFPESHYQLYGEGRWTGNYNGLRLINIALGLAYIW